MLVLLHVQAQGETPLSKEQEAELMQQTLTALGEMRIRYPGKSEEEAEAVLDEVRHAAERKRSVRAGRPAALCSPRSPNSFEDVQAIHSISHCM